MSVAVVEVSDSARRDVLEIFAYIEQDSPQNAWRVLDGFEQAFALLSRMPLAGHTREDVADPTRRFWTVMSYSIAYRFMNGRVRVSRVVHASRDFTKIDWR